jgi:hypothetical protein
MVVAITQFGIDGFGHQLHGLFTSLLLHGVRDYYFDGYMYINHKFSFEHIKGDEAILAKEYLIACVKQFIKEYNLTPVTYNNYIFSGGQSFIPKNSDSDTLYGIDNAYNFHHLSPLLNNEEEKKHTENINTMKKFFINDNLPKNRLVDDNIVIHIRLGDATDRNGNQKYIYQILELIDLLNIKYPHHNYYIHTDGNVNFIEEKLNKLNINYTLFNKPTKILEVLSDFIHAKILICGASSLSSVASFFGNKELIICNDNPCSMLNEEHVYKISDYFKKHVRI